MEAKCLTWLGFDGIACYIAHNDAPHVFLSIDHISLTMGPFGLFYSQVLLLLSSF